MNYTQEQFASVYGYKFNKGQVIPSNYHTATYRPTGVELRLVKETFTTKGSWVVRATEWRCDSSGYTQIFKSPASTGVESRLSWFVEELTGF